MPGIKVDEDQGTVNTSFSNQTSVLANVSESMAAGPLNLAAMLPSLAVGIVR
jgi:hypothetical protein